MASKLTYRLKEEDLIHNIRMVLKLRLGCSTRLLREARDKGDITLNGEHVRLVDKGKAGDLIEVILPEEKPEALPEAIPLDVVYEDGDFLVLNKQPGLPVHPSKGHPFGTILNGVVHYMQQKGEEYLPRMVNRLDLDTSGLLVVGKNAYVQEDFAKQAAKGNTRKTYFAVTEGIPEPLEGIVDRPIGQPDPENVQRAVCEDGAEARTRYQVLKTANGRSLLRLELETGRTHQIRVHMAHMGHPLVGDFLYGTEDHSLISRAALHSHALYFRHPITGQEMAFVQELPPDIEWLLRN